MVLDLKEAKPRRGQWRLEWGSVSGGSAERGWVCLIPERSVHTLSLQSSWGTREAVLGFPSHHKLGSRPPQPWVSTGQLTMARLP